ncbi:MAG: hypothetical protein HOV83_38620 [Catenulispora sp.]|nr:hypothetical protein [Catenulispora sp.]
MTILGANTENPGFPHYGSGAAATGSAIFIGLLAAMLVSVWIRRRRK